MEKELLFELYGFEVYSDSRYVVKDKEDLDAPSGFIQAGVTKLPSDGVGESFQCYYKRTSATTGVWDTGFYIYSPCYEHIRSEAEKQVIVDRLMKGVVEPYRKATGNPNALDHSDNEFWKKTNFQVYTNQVFTTSNPSDVLNLYFALKTRYLTPKGQEGDSRFNQSAYVVVDIDKDTKRNDEKTSNFYRAVGVFENLLREDRKRLISILNYSGLVVASEIDDDAFRGLFDQHLRSVNNSKNVDMFLKIVNETETEIGRATVDLFLCLKKSFNRNNKVTKNPNGVFFYEDTEIGPDLKAAASNIAKQAEFKDIKKELLLQDEVANEN